MENSIDNIRIVDALPEDAPLIAWALTEAIGEEIVEKLADGRGADVVRGVFETLARREDTQYSYRNTRIALGPDGNKAGISISYDGGVLKELRKTFFRAANENLGWSISEEEMDIYPCETDGEEFYLDTLAVKPEYRRQGLGSALIMDAAVKAAKAGIPLGLLVADYNAKARGVYESCGMKPVGRRLFGGEEMTNMRMPR